MIDGGFRLSDGHALAKAIVATGKRLTTIYISQSDPDYYFGLAPVLEAFPDSPMAEEYRELARRVLAACGA